jgi:hypothetical protein
MAGQSCRIIVQPPPAEVTSPLKDAVKQQHELSASSLGKAREALAAVAASLLADVTAEQVAGYVQEGVDATTFLSSIVAKKKAAGFYNLSQDAIDKRKSILKSLIPRCNAYDTEIAMGQLIAGLSEEYAKYHKAVLSVETGFDAGVIRCRWDDNAKGRNKRCAGGMMGMGQISKKWHVDKNNPVSNPNKYTTGQLEMALELNVEVSSRFFKSLAVGNTKEARLKRAVRGYKGGTDVAKIDEYEIRFRNAYRGLYGENAW